MIRPYVSTIMKLAATYLMFSAVCFGAGTELDFDDVKSADAHRQKTLQMLHVAQAPLHSKQDKATESEVRKYQEAVAEAVNFQQWVAHDGKRSLSLSYTGNNSGDTLNTKKFSKFIWEVHDSKIKATPPFSRSDIGVAIKMMNDARELFQLPIVISRHARMPKRQ